MVNAEVIEFSLADGAPLEELKGVREEKPYFLLQLHGHESPRSEDSSF